jgi:class 3 adenylate cyclase
MKWFESTVAYLFPTILLDGTPWRPIWEDEQREQFLRIARFFFPAAAIGYVVHFYVFDLPMGLEPIDFWFRFRLSIAAVLFSAFVFYISPLVRWRMYKLPALCVCALLCYSQAKVAVWYGKEAWFFFFLFVLASGMVLRMSSFKSALYALVVIVASSTELMAGGVPVENLISGTLVTLGVLVVVRTSTLSDVRHFLLTQENISNQRKMIEMNIEFADRIKSFIPKVIADRLTDLMENEHMTVVEASIEALKARKKPIACLFTDIRGYTQGSKELDSFITESVLPEVNECSKRVEELEGIPRKIGDLLFAYFDCESAHMNVLRAMLSGIEIARINESMNATAASVKIRRYILIASGEAMVGNFGGLDSSIEITALGTPVNFLSRVDELTKTPVIASKIDTGDLILCEQTARSLCELGIDLPLQRIDLRLENLSIRDFPERQIVYRLTPTDDSYELLLEAHRLGKHALDERIHKRANGKSQKQI